LISADGEQLGIKHIREAMDYGERADLDLVEVAPNANPPVVRMMDYGKFKYQKEQARKAARKKQVNVNVREIKVTIMFRGREVQHPELGERLLRRLAGDLDELGRIESQPNLDGRNMVMVMAPKKDSSQAEAPQANGRRERAARR
jgi:translation initiation factor IF-3